MTTKRRRLQRHDNIMHDTRDRAVNPIVRFRPRHSCHAQYKDLPYKVRTHHRPHLKNNASKTSAYCRCEIMPNNHIDSPKTLSEESYTDEDDSRVILTRHSAYLVDDTMWLHRGGGNTSADCPVSAWMEEGTSGSGRLLDEL